MQHYIISELFQCGKSYFSFVLSEKLDAEVRFGCRVVIAPPGSGAYFAPKRLPSPIPIPIFRPALLGRRSMCMNLRLLCVGAHFQSLLSPISLCVCVCVCVCVFFFFPSPKGTSASILNEIFRNNGALLCLRQ